VTALTGVAPRGPITVRAALYSGLRECYRSAGCGFARPRGARGEGLVLVAEDWYRRLQPSFAFCAFTTFVGILASLGRMASAMAKPFAEK
jgi:hypothetical protein